MTHLYIEYDATNAIIATIRAFVAHEELYNAAWAGENIEVKRDDHTWIDSTQEYAASQLLNAVQHMLTVAGRDVVELRITVY